MHDPLTHFAAVRNLYLFHQFLIFYNVIIISVGDHLAECHSIALVQVLFPKIRNLANFKADLSRPQNLGWHLIKWSVCGGTWPGD